MRRTFLRHSCGATCRAVLAISCFISSLASRQIASMSAMKGPAKCASTCRTHSEHNAMLHAGTTETFYEHHSCVQRLCNNAKGGLQLNTTDCIHRLNSALPYTLPCVLCLLNMGSMM